MRAREAIIRMIETDDELPLLCARRIKQFEGWNVSDDEARSRLRQALRGTARRHFEIDWYPILQDIFARYGVDDMVSPLAYEARQNAEYELRKEARQMRSVSARRSARRVG